MRAVPLKHIRPSLLADLIFYALTAIRIDTCKASVFFLRLSNATAMRAYYTSLSLFTFLMRTPLHNSLGICSTTSRPAAGKRRSGNASSS